MRKSIYVFLAVLAVFAMVMTGCPDPKPSGDKTYTVTFNSMGGSDVAPITGVNSGEIITKPSPNPTKDGYNFSAWYKEEALTNLWIFSTDTVTKNTTLYAKWIPAGQAATIRQILINNTDLDEVQGASMGEPDSDLEYVVSGVFEPGIPQPAGGVAIAVTATNTAADVKWLVKGSTPTEAEFTDSANTTPATFAEGDKLYIKVVNGSNTLYYIIEVFFINVETIYYGQPAINGSTIDPLWEANYGNGPVFDISRITTDVATNFKFLNTVDGAKAHTLGSAKAYWDDQGLYIYATVEFHDYYADEAAKASNTPTARVTQKRGNYESDSLEIMLNTRYQKLLEDPANINYGQQYRVGFSDGDASQASNTFPSKNAPTESFVIGSGNHNSLPTGVINTDIRNAFQQSGDFYAWITKDAAGKETGYKIICKVPWYIIGYDQTNQVFDMTTGLVKTNAKIGLEFQLNTSTTPAGSNPSRDGALTWNSVTSQGVTNVTNYGVVTLARGTNAQIINTHAPVIRTQPAAEKTFDPADPGAITDLTVEAVVGPTVPTASLAYKWYKAADATVDGSEVSGAISATLKPSVTAAETAYYYVVVTNTNNAATGSKTATVTSTRAKVYPKAPIANHVVSGGPWQNTELWNGQYNNGIVIDVQKDGQPISRDDYGTFTIVVKFYSDAAHTTEVQPADLPNNAFQFKWFPTVVSNANGSGNYGDTYQWGKTPAAYTNASLPSGSNAIAAISIQTGGESFDRPYIVIESVTFYPK